MLRFQIKQGSDYRILYNASTASQIDAAWFDPEYWEQQGQLLGGAPGRGTSCFVKHHHQEFVLRHYHRGGLVGRWLKDKYLWLGLARTRPWREMHLLAKLWAMGLPVPTPVAAQVVRQGVWYRADLLTQRLPDVVPLADIIHELPVVALQVVGHTIRRFHRAGLYHVDLNPRNIVVNPITEEVFLLDFDRCKLFGKPLDPVRCRANLNRLHRAFLKHHREQADQWMQVIEQAYWSI